MSAISRANGLGCARSRMTATCNNGRVWRWLAIASRIRCFDLKLLVVHEAIHATTHRLGLASRRGVRGAAVFLAHGADGDTDAYLRLFRVLHRCAAHTPRPG